MKLSYGFWNKLHLDAQVMFAAFSRPGCTACRVIASFRHNVRVCSLTLTD